MRCDACRRSAAWGVEMPRKKGQHPARFALCDRHARHLIWDLECHVWKLAKESA